MKSIDQQITFLDRILLPLYGFKSIIDYDKILTVDMIEEIPELLSKVNNILPVILDTFPVKRFNLHKTHHHIETIQQSFNVLVQCLEISQIPFNMWSEVHSKHTVRYLQLYKENVQLTSYINRLISTKPEVAVTCNNYTGTSGSSKDLPVLSNDEVSSVIKELIEDDLYLMVSSNKFEIKLQETPFRSYIIKNIDLSLVDELYEPTISRNTNYQLELCNHVVSKSLLMNGSDLFPHNFICPCQCIKLLLSNINDHPFPMWLKCHVSKIGFSHKKYETFKNSKFVLAFDSMNDLIIDHSVSELDCHISTHPNTTKSSGIILLSNNWKGVPNDFDSNKTHLVDMINNKNITEINQQNFPFISIEKYQLLTIANCGERKIYDSDLMMLCATLTYNQQHIHAICTRSINRYIDIIPMIYHDNKIINCELSHICADTISNILIEIDSPQLIHPIDVKLLSEDELICQFNENNTTLSNIVSNVVSTYSSSLPKKNHIVLHTSSLYLQLIVPLNSSNITQINIQSDNYWFNNDYQIKLSSNICPKIIDISNFTL